MKMKIYHGSDHIIKKPLFGEGKKYNDYGLGFYCTKNLELALEWAVNIDHDGYANEYEIETTDLKILDLCDKKYSVLNWLAVLLENRIFDTDTPLASSAKEYLLKNFKPNYKSYDIIIGYRADDSYFSYASDFLNGSISLEQLKNAMELGLLGIQVVIKSEKAFSLVRYKSYNEASRKIFLDKKIQRDEKARYDYRNKVLKDLDLNGIFIQDILREEMKENDTRIR